LICKQISYLLRMNPKIRIFYLLVIPISGLGQVKYFKSYQFAEVGEVGIMVILMVVFLFAAVVAIVRQTKVGLNYLPAGSYRAAVANAIL
jgi:hypothetical protein